MPESAAPDAAARHKQQAAERAVDLVRHGMIVGLGTGSTAVFAIRRIGALLRSGELRDVVGIPPRQHPKRRHAGRRPPRGARAVPGSRRHHRRGRRGDSGTRSDQGPGRGPVAGKGGGPGQPPRGHRGGREQAVAQAGNPLTAARWRFCASVGARRSAFSSCWGPGSTPCRPPTASPSSPTRAISFSCATSVRSSAPAELAACLAARAGIVEHGLFLGLGNRSDRSGSVRRRSAAAAIRRRAGDVTVQILPDPLALARALAELVADRAAAARRRPRPLHPVARGRLHPQGGLWASGQRRIRAADRLVAGAGVLWGRALRTARPSPEQLPDGSRGAPRSRPHSTGQRTPGPGRAGPPRRRRRV